MADEALQVGDVVRLKSVSLAMTVSGVKDMENGRVVWCKYFHDGKFQEEDFREELLVKWNERLHGDL